MGPPQASGVPIGSWGLLSSGKCQSLLEGSPYVIGLTVAPKRSNLVGEGPVGTCCPQFRSFFQPLEGCRPRVWSNG